MFGRRYASIRDEADVRSSQGQSGIDTDWLGEELDMTVWSLDD